MSLIRFCFKQFDYSLQKRISLVVIKYQVSVIYYNRMRNSIISYFIIIQLRVPGIFFLHRTRADLLRTIVHTIPLYELTDCNLLCVLQVHAYIISYLKKEMPSLFGKEKKKEELIAHLPEIYQILQREHHISPGDFPNVIKMQVRSGLCPWNMGKYQMLYYSVYICLQSKQN